ncbi:MAG TPA: hypothetical protein VFS52_20605 [Steroidobacteraceae bacterium]|jgi:hypothetical protein|nr:hypothetical protein [Steroidobacteraceae bacterium]
MPTPSRDTRADDAVRMLPLPRTYFVGGHRVEHLRDAYGQSSWSCDCVEYARGKQWGGEHWCQHAERVAAAAELDRVLRTPQLIVSRKSY